MQKPQLLSSDYTDEIISILAKSKLPTDDIDLSVQKFVGISADDQLSGIGALEIYGSSALLRSMAVVYSGQNKGLGSLLVNRLIQIAAESNIKKIFLLTETAEPFFSKKGFQRINRSEVPAAILKAPEFKHLCPTTAVCMSFEIE